VKDQRLNFHFKIIGRKYNHIIFKSGTEVTERLRMQRTS